MHLRAQRRAGLCVASCLYLSIFVSTSEDLSVSVSLLLHCGFHSLLHVSTGARMHSLFLFACLWMSRSPPFYLFLPHLCPLSVAALHVPLSLSVPLTTLSLFRCPSSLLFLSLSLDTVSQPTYIFLLHRHATSTQISRTLSARSSPSVFAHVPPLSRSLSPHIYCSCLLSLYISSSLFLCFSSAVYLLSIFHNATTLAEHMPFFAPSCFCVSICHIHPCHPLHKCLALSLFASPFQSHPVPGSITPVPLLR